MPKPKIAFYWCAACGGCEEAVVDLAEDVLRVLDAVEVVFWPVAMDFKKADVARLPDRAIDATLLNGAIRSSEQAEMARLLRRKSRLLVAYGSCACQGGIPGLANQFSRDELLDYTFADAPTVSNNGGNRPQLRTGTDGHTLELPELSQAVHTLDQVVEVDYYIPGCPPPAKLTRAALDAIVSGQLPPKGAVLAPDTALCEECPRRGTKPVDLAFTRFRRPHETRLDPEKCLLAQGVICLGPATRGGCSAACIAANMPCTGCGGPTSRVRDVGAKMLSSVAANLAAREPAEIGRALDGIPDPVGTFYRYGLPGSLLHGKTDLPAPSPASPP